MVNAIVVLIPPNPLGIIHMSVNACCFEPAVVLIPPNPLGIILKNFLSLNLAKSCCPDTAKSSRYNL